MTRSSHIGDLHQLLLHLWYHVVIVTWASRNPDNSLVLTILRNPGVFRVLTDLAQVLALVPVYGSLVARSDATRRRLIKDMTFENIFGVIWVEFLRLLPNWNMSSWGVETPLACLT